MFSHRDQKKYLDTLKKYERRFTRQEYDEYKMFVKREKDDEEFDSIAMKRLKELYTKYYEKADTSKYEKFFKKNSGTESDK
jgi:hypothetical protein